MRFNRFAERSRDLAQKHRPFLFIVNYEMDDFQLFEPQEAAANGIFFRIRGVDNLRWGSFKRDLPDTPVQFERFPMPFEAYESAFDQVRRHILHGNSFLLNLTFPTPIEMNVELEELFLRSRAPYTLLYQKQFVVFSPESFIRIEDGRIHSFPMKGTIDASSEDAGRRIMEDKKELWEHNTIVDLIRNDLSMVASDVKVNRFRYIQEVKTNEQDLLQVSSHISGKLDSGWRRAFPDLLQRLLPAGSICGAPKQKTLEIIREAEGLRRDFFTGVFGYYDGQRVDSAVMIRFIEQFEKGFRFRSGGGITGHSDADSEYREMLQKVYVPIL